MTYIGAVFLVQLTRDTSQTSKWGQTRLGCVLEACPFISLIVQEYETNVEV